MLSRRGLGKAAAMGSFGALGGLPPQRPDQRHNPSQPALGAGPRSIGPQPFVVIFGTGPRRGLFVYSGPPAHGNLIASISASGGTDKFGNVVAAGIASYDPAFSRDFADLFGGSLSLGSQNPASVLAARATVGLIDATGAAQPPAMQVVSPATSAAGLVSLLLYGESQDTTSPAQAIFGRSPTAVGSTAALVEVQGDLQAGDGLSIGQGLAVQTLVNGSTITTAGKTMQPVTAAASVTGIILQAGTFDGQCISLPSDAASGVTITFAAAATSHVKTGVATVIQPGSALELRWVASTGFWYPVQ